jgi:hypothetical protein
MPAFGDEGWHLVFGIKLLLDHFHGMKLIVQSSVNKVVKAVPLAAAARNINQ